MLRRRLWRLAFLGAVVLGLFVVPRIAWELWPLRPMNVVIVDKTVPFQNYREHQNFDWLLEAWKIGTPDGRFLDPASDYVGFDPTAKRGHDLTADHLQGAKVLFVADTCGVYRGDYEVPGVAALERSQKIYGGFTVAEAQAIDSFVGGCGTAIAEFNAFASPTGDAARARLEALFGVHWTHWVARYWPNVRDENEVPPWIGRVYERVFGRPFDVTGPALIFVRDDVDMVVLQPSLHFENADRIVTMHRTEEAPELAGLPREGSFYFWLDVVDATTADVVYQYQVDVNRAGAEELTKHGLPLRFPALTRRPGAYYFAGDMVDSTVELGDPRRKGLLAFRRARAWLGGSFEERLMWGWYAPVMEALIGTAGPRCRDE